MLHLHWSSLYNKIAVKVRQVGILNSHSYVKLIKEVFFGMLVSRQTCALLVDSHSCVSEVVKESSTTSKIYNFSQLIQRSMGELLF